MYVSEATSVLFSILETLLSNPLTSIIVVLLVMSISIDYLVYRSNKRLFEGENT